MDVVALSLVDVQTELTANNIAYSVTLTSPSRNVFVLADEALYVVRQQAGTDGVLQLTVAAKMTGAKA